MADLGGGLRCLLGTESGLEVRKGTSSMQPSGIWDQGRGSLGGG